MANTSRKMAVTVVVTTLGMATAAAASEVRDTIVLTIANQCRVPQPVLEAAQEAATSPYNAIGVRLVWRPAGLAPSPEIAGALQFRVTLVTEVAEGRLLAALPLPSAERQNVVGMAQRNSRTAFLFCYRIQRLARLSTISAVEIALGRALAHEIGHLVLPHMVHSETGIMRARLDLHSEATPAFTDVQGESIRALLVASK